jgi:hypothetical protein
MDRRGGVVVDVFLTISLYFNTCFKLGHYRTYYLQRLEVDSIGTLWEISGYKCDRSEIRISSESKDILEEIPHADDLFSRRL